jgi:di/tricarboxylate transporter
MFHPVCQSLSGKGMIVSMSRRIAADLYAQIIKIKPDWHSDDLDKGMIKVVMTPFIGLSIYSVCKLGASKPVSHISRTITNLSGSSGCFILSAKVFLCALVVWCLEISGPSDELEVITTLITPL